MLLELSTLPCCDSVQAVDAYLDHPEHEGYYEGFLEPQVQVIKAWNFRV